MLASKITIRFSAIASFILLTLTYLVTVNIETSFICIDSPWISNNFLLAFFGGAFASMVVVLLCEISKYWQAKHNAEIYLFSHLFYLYGQLQIIAKNINWLKTQNQEFLHKDSLNQVIANATAEMNAIYFAEYSPFRRRNSVLQEKQYYNTNIFFSVQQFIQDCYMFGIAVIEDRLETNLCQLENRQRKPYVAPEVLQKLSELIIQPIQSVDSMISRIDRSCKGRFKWEKTKTDFLRGLPDNRNDALERFLEKK